MFKVGDKVKKVSGKSFADGDKVAEIAGIQGPIDSTARLNFTGRKGWCYLREVEMVEEAGFSGEYVYLIIGTDNDNPDTIIAAFNDNVQADDVLSMIKKSGPMFNVRKEAVKLR